MRTGLAAAVFSLALVLAGCADGSGNEGSRAEFIEDVDRATGGAWRDALNDEDALVQFLGTICRILEDAPDAEPVDPEAARIQVVIQGGNWCETELAHN